ncbi:MAG: hypothetical protein ABI263_01050 [Gelidibacter sp.]
MTDTLIALISIFIGIFGANLFAVLKKKYNMGFTGNTIAGVFGSIFFIKVFGRLGFGPMAIMKTGEVNTILFTINILVSLLGGAIGLIVTKLIRNRLKNRAK